MANPFCERVGVDVPVVLAPMGGAVGPELTAAVSNAGGLGCIPLWEGKPEQVREQIRAVRKLAPRPFAVNLNLNWPQEERLEVCLDEAVPIVSMFWGLDAAMIERAHQGGALVMQTVGSAAEARRAVDSGADVIVAQGWEAGGHVWGKVTTLALVPVVVDAVGAVPVVAAGGIADGRGLAAVLSLGASAAWIGTRFLMSHEATIHRRYRECLAAADETSTYYGTLFDVGWPDGPHRTLRNDTVDAWERAGRPEQRPSAGRGRETCRDAGRRRCPLQLHDAAAGHRRRYRQSVAVGGAGRRACSPPSAGFGDRPRDRRGSRTGAPPCSGYDRGLIDAAPQMAGAGVVSRDLPRVEEDSHDLRTLLLAGHTGARRVRPPGARGGGRRLPSTWRGRTAPAR